MQWVESRMSVKGLKEDVLTFALPPHAGMRDLFG